MPSATPARLPLDRLLDEMLRSLQAEPAPAALIGLADRLEDAWRGARIPGEGRAIA
jgi:hypothetical protein